MNVSHVHVLVHAHCCYMYSTTEYFSRLTLTYMYLQDESEETADSLRNFLNLEDRSPLVLLLDIPNNKKFVLPESEAPSKERLQKMLKDFSENQLSMVALRS